MAKKGGLGKGLDAIFYDNAREDDAGRGGAQHKRLRAEPHAAAPEL